MNSSTPIDWEFFRTSVMVANLLGTVGVGLWAWLRGPSEANATRLDKLDDDLREQREETSSRFDKIETRLQFIPTVTEIGNLQADLREVKATQASLQREMHQLGTSLTRIEDFLLSPSKR